MSSTPSSPQTPGGAAPAAPKSSGAKILLWVVGIVVGLILICFASCAVIGFYAMHRMKQAGFNSDLMKTNPGLAGAKMAVTMNPDTEIISSDDKAGTIVVRDKKTGKVVTMKFDQQKKTMVITDENGKTTSFTSTGEGATSSMEMKSPEGTMKIGNGSDKAPDWVPVYPGSAPQSTFSASSGAEQTGSYTFVTKDPADKVISFYGDSLKSAGFTVANMTTNSDGKVGGMVSGEDKANKRAVVVTLGTDNDGTHVNLTFTVKQ
ncbi:MAG: hypothetical protein ABSA27_17010 [Terriglobales bacterium]|jgi:hypothetical protein